MPFLKTSMLKYHSTVQKDLILHFISTNKVSYLNPCFLSFIFPATGIEKTRNASCTSVTPPITTDTSTIPNSSIVNPNPTFPDLSQTSVMANGSCAAESTAAYPTYHPDNQYANYGPTSCYFRSNTRPTPYSRDVSYMRDSRYCTNGLGSYMGRSNPQFGYDPSSMMGTITDPRRNYNMV